MREPAGEIDLRLPVPRIVDQAVCLRHWDWSETSQTVSLLTRGHGAMRGLAKGSRRDRAPFSGGIEIATRGEAVLIPKPGGLATIAAWDLQETFPGVRTSSRGFFAAMYLLDLAQHFVQEDDPHPSVFDALCGALRDLAVGGPAMAPVVRMQWACLSESGLRPVLDHDAATGGPLAAGPALGLSPTLGGLVADPGADARPGVYRVRTQTVELLRSLDRPGEGSPCSPESYERAARLLDMYAQHMLGRALASGPALFAGR